jgi:hypothetical protein
VEVGGDHDPEPGAGLDVDVGEDAALADQPQGREAFQQFGGDGRPFADEDEDLGGDQASGELVHIVDMVVPDGDLVSVEGGEAVECPDRVEVVVQNRHTHGRGPLRQV